MGGGAGARCRRGGGLGAQAAGHPWATSRWEEHEGRWSPWGQAPSRGQARCAQGQAGSRADSTLVVTTNSSGTKKAVHGDTVGRKPLSRQTQGAPGPRPVSWLPAWPCPGHSGGIGDRMFVRLWVLMFLLCPCNEQSPQAFGVTPNQAPRGRGYPARRRLLSPRREMPRLQSFSGRGEEAGGFPFQTPQSEPEEVAILLQ